METLTLVNGTITRLSVMEPIKTLMAPNMKDSGPMIYRTAMEKKLGEMKLSTKDSTKMGKKKDRESMFGKTTLSTEGNGRTTRSMG